MISTIRHTNETAKADQPTNAWSEKNPRVAGTLAFIPTIVRVEKSESGFTTDVIFVKQSTRFDSIPGINERWFRRRQSGREYLVEQRPDAWSATGCAWADS
jgi:hypothetical protein